MPKLILLLIIAAAFVFLTGNELPPTVASHFMVGGTANSFMPRSNYLGFVLALTVGLPLALALLSTLSHFLPARFINLPDREYWLAPERREQTLAFLSNQGIYLAMLLAIFLCFVHWLVVLANAQQPAHFPESTLFASLPLFLIALAVWIGRFILHFKRRH